MIPARISNTFAVLVGQRVRELALLRTLGARGGSLVKMLLIESLIVGLVSSIIGALAAYGLAALIGAFFDIVVISYDPLAFIVAVVLCTLVTILASLAPARSALRISPISAMGETTAMALKKPGIIGPIIGVLLGIGGALALSAALADAGSMTGVGMAFLGVFLISIAVFLLTPWLLLPLIRLLGLLARTQTGQLALANALRAPKRTVSTGRAVLVGTLVVTTVLTGHSVMNASITHMMDKAFPISAIGSYGGGTSANGAETVEKAKKALNNVTSVPNVEYATLSYAAGVVEINPARKLHRIGG